MRWFRLIGLIAVFATLLLVPQRRAAANDDRQWLAEPLLLKNGKYAATVDVAPVDATHTWAIQGNHIMVHNGSTWSIQFTADQPFSSIAMTSIQHGWALAQGSQINPEHAMLYEFNGTKWQATSHPNTIITGGIYAAHDGTLLATGWNGINGSNSRQTLEYFDGTWHTITPFDRGAYRVQTTNDGSTWVWGNSITGISAFDASQPFVLRYANGVLSTINVPSAGASGPDVINREGLVSVQMISSTEGWASIVTTKNQPKIYHYLNGIWNETNFPIPAEYAGQPYQHITFVAGNSSTVIAQVQWQQACKEHSVLAYSNSDQTWHSLGKVAAELSGGLIGNSTNGWFSSASHCLSAATRYAFNGSVLMADQNGSDVAPRQYKLISNDTQWAYGEGMILHFTSNTMPVQPVAAKPNARYFAETGHNIQGAFRTFYESNGLDFGEPGISAGESLALFGLPLTEEFQELNPDTGDYLTVQYFERVRMEYHPENPQPYKVLLGRLGASRYVQVHSYIQDGDANAPIGDGCERFVETQHDLCPPFRTYWRSVGSVQIFGLPIANAESEPSYTDGANYLTLWTERERLEHHTELAGTRYEILLGLLAKEDLRMRGYLD